jgi:hypothetical protein
MYRSRNPFEKTTLGETNLGRVSDWQNLKDASGHQMCKSQLCSLAVDKFIQIDIPIASVSPVFQMVAKHVTR